MIDIPSILSDIELGWPNLHLIVKQDGDSYTLQIQDENLPVEFNTGRKWRLSKFMTKSEIVQTAFAAVDAWFDHEVRELFKYKGQSVFNPHFDVDALHAIAADKCFEYREPVTT